MKDSFGEASTMRLIAKQDDVLEIEVSRADLEHLITILNQTKHVDTDFHELSPEDQEIVKGLVTTALAKEGDAQTISISRSLFDDIPGYTFAAWAASTQTLEDITEDELDALNDKVFMIFYSLKPEDQILRIEAKEGITVPRFEQQ